MSYCVYLHISSAGKESTCNAGDPGSISGWGRFTGEGIGYPLQFSWVSLMAQLLNGGGNGTPTPVLLPGKSHGQRSLVGCSPWGR